MHQGMTMPYPLKFSKVDMSIGIRSKLSNSTMFAKLKPLENKRNVPLKFTIELHWNKINSWGRADYAQQLLIAPNFFSPSCITDS